MIINIVTLLDISQFISQKAERFGKPSYSIAYIHDGDKHVYISYYINSSILIGWVAKDILAIF